MTVKDNRKEAPATTFQPGYNSLDRKGTWFYSNAFFPLEDPTNAGKGALPRFEERSYTQAPETPWTDGQWKAGVLKKFDGDPRDDETKELAYSEQAAQPAETSETKPQLPAKK